MVLQRNRSASLLILAAMTFGLVSPRASGESPSASPIDDIRDQMNHPPTQEQLRQFQQALKRQLGAAPSKHESDSTESFAKEFIWHIWKPARRLKN